MLVGEAPGISLWCLREKKPILIRQCQPMAVQFLTGSNLCHCFEIIFAKKGRFIHVRSKISWYVCSMYLGTKGDFFSYWGQLMLPFWNHILANLGLFIHVRSWILWYVCCMYLGTKGAFSDLCFFVISLPAALWVIYHYSSIRVPTLILCVEVSFSPYFRLCMRTCCHIIATSPQTICHHHREASHMTSYF